MFHSISGQGPVSAAFSGSPPEGQGAHDPARCVDGEEEEQRTKGGKTRMILLDPAHRGVNDIATTKLMANLRKCDMQI